ncbi:MAG: TrbI/VirB10 family protein [Selenomonadaceae bacterium]|nr:TrbI/VirB10 family protein [Selenomonadaceae bacterium]
MWWNNLRIWLKNLVGKPDKNEEKKSYDEEKDDDFETPIEAKKEDKAPGNVKMNGGSHGNVQGLNRKFVGMGLGFLILLIAVMWGYNIQDTNEKKAAEKEKAAINTEDTAAKVSLQNADVGYSDVFVPEQQGLAGANSRFVNRRNPNNAQTGTDSQDPSKNGLTNNGNAQKSSQSEESQTPVTSSTPVVATPTVPQIPSYSYSSLSPTAISTPTAVATQGARQESEAKRADNERERQAERYRSAISFGLNSGENNGLAQSGNGSSVAVNSQGGQGGQGKTLASTSQSPFPSSPIQYMAASDGVLQAGTLIPAVLFSGINTNVAGQVTAQTMSDVYDTATRSNLLIPAGSQLIGSYEAGASSGNNRVNVTFSTLVLPDGSSYAIDNSMVAVDGAGYNGIAGKLDHHTDKALRDGLLNSAFTAIASKWTERVYLDMSSISNITKMEGVRPTITINPGKEFNLFVTRPIIFEQ